MTPYARMPPPPAPSSWLRPDMAGIVSAVHGELAKPRGGIIDVEKLPTVPPMCEGCEHRASLALITGPEAWPLCRGCLARLFDRTAWAFRLAKKSQPKYPP